MSDSRSQPDVANCRKEFPEHAIRESEGQKAGLMYKGANGALIPNQGEIDIVHRENDGRLYNFTIQHADVHCIIISVKYLVTRDCSVTFHKKGGHIKYPDGRRLRFITKDCVFFMELNVLPPTEPSSGFIRHGQP